MDLNSLKIFFLRLFFLAKFNKVSSNFDSLQLIFKNDRIILTICFPSLNDLGSFIFLSNLFKISEELLSVNEKKEEIKEQIKLNETNINWSYGFR